MTRNLRVVKERPLQFQFEKWRIHNQEITRITPPLKKGGFNEFTIHNLHSQFSAQGLM